MSPEMSASVIWRNRKAIAIEKLSNMLAIILFHARNQNQSKLVFCYAKANGAAA